MKEVYSEPPNVKKFHGGDTTPIPQPSYKDHALGT